MSLPSSRLLELRIARLATTHGGYESAYAKRPVTEPVRLQALGFEGDERTQQHHGGPDRAVLGYDPRHYEAWAAELPELAAAFAPGALGENLVVPGLDEQSLCVGDVIALGAAVVQVTQTRSPCYKINDHFGRKGMARLTQTSGRCGWLARVLTEGLVAPGDRVEVVERPCPEWPLTRLNEVLYGRGFDAALASELVELEPLASSVREKFARRLASRSVESFAERLGETPDASR